ncbi:MAG: enoyl-CoA hydratase [Desulfobacteraceae bacterium]|nr:enoyl-CoA hydratase [Desulfobacteraceae bacterium]
MNDDILLTEERDGVALLTLNRPEVMNSLNVALLHRLRDQVDALRFRRDLRVILVTGVGEKAFCAGADLKERATMKPEQVKDYILTIRTLFSSIENMPQPVIAAVNGVALGGGTELALAADIRLAATTATMGLTETRLAIIPGAGGTQRLPRLIGKGKAKELIFTGRRVGAEEALALGLVNRVCDPDRLISESMQMALQIAEGGPIAIEQAKYAINFGMETDLNTGLAIESNAYWVCIPTEDRLEGLAAFREKRKPVYKGR